MAEEEKPVVKPPPPYQPIKYFVSSLNTFLGQHLVARLRNEQQHPENPHRIVGTTIAKSSYPVPAGVRKIIDVLNTLVRQKKSPSLKKSSSTQMLSSMTSLLQTSKKQSSLSQLLKYILSKIIKHSSAFRTS